MENIIGIIIFIVILGLVFGKKSGSKGGGGCSNCGSNDIRPTSKPGYSYKCRSCGNEMK